MSNIGIKSKGDFELNIKRIERLTPKTTPMRGRLLKPIKKNIVNNIKPTDKEVINITLSFVSLFSITKPIGEVTRKDKVK